MMENDKPLQLQGKKDLYDYKRNFDGTKTDDVYLAYRRECFFEMGEEGRLKGEALKDYEDGNF